MVGRLFDDTFALSFTGNGYLFTKSLSSRRSDDILVIKIKPLSTEGLVMFAYDKQVCVNHDLSVIHCAYMVGFFRSTL